MKWKIENSRFLIIESSSRYDWRVFCNDSFLHNLEGQRYQSSNINCHRLFLWYFQCNPCFFRKTRKTKNLCSIRPDRQFDGKTTMFADHLQKKLVKLTEFFSNEILGKGFAKNFGLTENFVKLKGERAFLVKLKRFFLLFWG